MTGPITVCPALLDPAGVETLLVPIDSAYHAIEQAESEQRESFVRQLLAKGHKYVPTASSLSLEAALSQTEVGLVLRALLDSAIAGLIAQRLGSRVALDLDQAWVRRQYAPRRRPKWHTPHTWHQDGALGFNFQNALPGRNPEDELLSMVTVWIALNDCGQSAPGLELVNRQLDRLLRPEQLTEIAVRAGFLADEFLVPVLRPGDAILFCGDILHRTHAAPDMQRDRTSIELRFFPAHQLPPRLGQDRFSVIELPLVGA